MKHILFDLKDCLFPSLLNDEEYIKETLKQASNIANLTIIKVDTHKFNPQGVTGYALLAESHISIHTWPEDDICRCDIFSCNPHSKLRNVVEYMKERFHSCEVKKWSCDRSDW